MSSSNPNSRKGKGKATSRGRAKNIANEQAFGNRLPTEEEMMQQAIYNSQQELYQTNFQSLLSQSQNFYDPTQLSPIQTHIPTNFQPHFQTPLFGYRPRGPSEASNQQPTTNPRFQPNLQTQHPISRPSNQQPTTNYRDTFDLTDADDDDDQTEEREFAPLSDDEIEEIAPRPPTRCKPVKWKENEEYFLCEAYMDISEDEIVGNQQKREGFWNRVVVRLAEITDRKDVERNDHQCNSKWKDLNKKVSLFAECFNNLKRSTPPSGTNEADLIEMARREYTVKTKGGTFKHDRIWQFLRFHPKWVTQPPMDEHPPKRSRTSESSDYENRVEVDFPEPPPPRRKGKSTASSSSGNISEEATSKFEEYIDSEKAEKKQFRETIVRLREERQRALDEIKFNHLRLMDREEKRKDLELFLKHHDHLSGYALELFLEQKREIAERWGWKFP